MSSTVSTVFLVFCLVLVSHAAVAKQKAAETIKQSENNLPQAARLHLVDEESSQPLPDSVKKLLKKYRMKQQNLSVYIRNLNAENPTMALNADTLRTPASTMKLLTTFAALKELGPNYTWRTEVYVRGTLKQGVLRGDLILKGYGDPFLVQEQFWKLLSRLRDKGLREIKGDLIVDNHYFDLPKHDSAKFDNQPYRVYNAPASALMYNFQATRFLFRPQVDQSVSISQSVQQQTGMAALRVSSEQSEPEVGQRIAQKIGSKNEKLSSTATKADAKKPDKQQTVEVIPFPSIRSFQFKNRIKLTQGRCRKSHYRPDFFRGKKGELIIKGNYSAKCRQQFLLRAVSTPVEHVYNAFRDTWRDLGGIHKGTYQEGRIRPGDELFHVHASPTLGIQMNLVNKWSNNVMTRQILLTLGARKYGAPGTPQKGERAILEILAENGISTDGISIENGSGLSRTAKLSARQLGQILEVAYRDPNMPEFMGSMALSGVDGTMVSRFRNEDLRGRGHFKTGTLRGVSAIAGYLLNRKGKRLVVVIIQNGKRVTAGRSHKIQDALLRWSFEH